MSNEDIGPTVVIYCEKHDLAVDCGPCFCSSGHVRLAIGINIDSTFKWNKDLNKERVLSHAY